LIGFVSPKQKDLICCFFLQDTQKVHRLGNHIAIVFPASTIPLFGIVLLGLGRKGAKHHRLRALTA
jgi:hypothetical protein